ncbi:MAG TPA: hypothetical protein VFY02_14575, partial [Gaiellaceae bacterium]|nr:hypothetical protein [Gaiellaceae bacterium]
LREGRACRLADLDEDSREPPVVLEALAVLVEARPPMKRKPCSGRAFAFSPSMQAREAWIREGSRADPRLSVERSTGSGSARGRALRYSAGHVA